MRLPPVICLNKFQKAIKLIGDGFIYLIIIVEVCRHKFYSYFGMTCRGAYCCYFCHKMEIGDVLIISSARVRDNFKDL